MVEGQLVHVATNIEKTVWDYGVITNVYDTVATVRSAKGQAYIIYLSEPFDDVLVLLTKNGAPVMVKKGIFGGYKIPQSGAAYDHY